MKVLMIAEKPSLATSIAKILSDDHYQTRKGISPVCSVLEYQSKLFNKPADFKVTSVAGHVFGLVYTWKFILGLYQTVQQLGRM
jgi:DNA topoisomerase-3